MTKTKLMGSKLYSSSEKSFPILNLPDFKNLASFALAIFLNIYSRKAFDFDLSFRQYSLVEQKPVLPIDCRS